MKCQAFVAVTLLLSAPVASAQGQTTDRVSLSVPTALFAGAAIGDWMTTYYGVSQHKFVEGNRLISPLQNRPALMVSAGATMDIGTFVIWRRYVARSHPKLAVVGLYAATGFRLYLSVKGLTLINQANLE